MFKGEGDYAAVKAKFGVDWRRLLNSNFLKGKPRHLGHKQSISYIKLRRTKKICDLHKSGHLPRCEAYLILLEPSMLAISMWITILRTRCSLRRIIKIYVRYSHISHNSLNAEEAALTEKFIAIVSIFATSHSITRNGYINQCFLYFVNSLFFNPMFILINYLYKLKSKIMAAIICHQDCSRVTVSRGLNCRKKLYSLECASLS